MKFCESPCDALLDIDTESGNISYKCYACGKTYNSDNANDGLIMSISKKVDYFDDRRLDNLVHDRSHMFVESPCKSCSAPLRKFTRGPNHMPIYVCVCGKIEKR